MKFPISMLRDLVDTNLTAEQVGDLLTMSMFELEGIEDVEGEEVLDIKVVSNRGDGLSVMGLAREVLAKDPSARPTPLYERSAGRFAERQQTDQGDLDTSVTIETSECHRYACKLFRDIPKASAPERIQKRLRQAGMRPISLFVDLTNYVMLEQGQPLHAFDQDKLAGRRIVVRQARRGEKLTTLNGDEHELRSGQMMICDAEKPVAAAGIMGGLETEVSDSTKNVLLESANFDRVSVRRTRVQMGLNTEASYRFERSVDPELVVAALERFCELLEESGARSCEVPGVIDVYPGRVQAPSIELSLARADRLLGMSIKPSEARGYLERLGFQVEAAGTSGGAHDAGQSYETPAPVASEQTFLVTPPTWRPDVTLEEDLVEELGRVHGYEKIPEVLPEGVTQLGVPGDFEAFLDAVRETALRAGLTEIFSHTLRDRDPLDDPSTGRVQPRNPSSPDTSYLRNSILPSLADAARRNGGREMHLFEQGRVFFRDGGQTIERTWLGILSQGALEGVHWEAKAPARADFFSVKGSLEEILESARVDYVFQAPAQADARLHPTKQANVLVGRNLVGRIGQIHPDTADKSDLPEDTVLAELMLEQIFDHRHAAPRLREISRNPAVRRDIAVLVDKSVPFETIERTVREATGGVLERQWLFDVYEGQNIPEGKHSLAIALQLRKLGENFTDEEANRVREKAVAALESLGAIRR